MPARLFGGHFRRGVIWISNLLAQRYGEFGEKDFHIPGGHGTAFICMPEKPKGLSILRLPNTCFSPVCLNVHILSPYYGIPRGIGADEETAKLMKGKFYKDWRFESLHLVNWHPWEDFIQHPAYRKAVGELVKLFKETENVGIMRPAEIAKWWLCRENLQIKEITQENKKILIKCGLASDCLTLNPTIRFSRIGGGLMISRVIIEGQEWRYFGRDWVALPIDVSGEIQISVEHGHASCYPHLVDTSSIVHEASLKGNTLKIVLEETRRREGKMSLHITRPSDIFIDNRRIISNALGYQTFSCKKGRHIIHLTGEWDKLSRK